MIRERVVIRSSLDRQLKIENCQFAIVPETHGTVVSPSHDASVHHPFAFARFRVVGTNHANQRPAGQTKPAIPRSTELRKRNRRTGGAFAVRSSLAVRAETKIHRSRGDLQAAHISV